MTITIFVSNVPLLLSFGGGCFSEAARSSLVDADDGPMDRQTLLLHEVVVGKQVVMPLLVFDRDTFESL